MKSINVRRVAALAAGAAMVGSVMASSVLGAVQTQGDVTSLVNSIKGNLDNVQVVLGTNHNGAAISDGVAGGRIGAMLASLNFEQATGVGAPDMTGVSCDLTGTPTVTVKGSGTLAQTTASKYIVEYTANTSATAGYQTAMAGMDTTITKSTFSDVLKEYTLQATVNNSATTFYYEDKIELNKGVVQYSENTAGTGHGLYYKLPWGTSGTAGLVYHIQFNGGGLPVSTNYGYQETPEITILGDTYGLDYQTTQNTVLKLFSSNKQTLLEGDSMTSGEYTVKITGIGSSTTSGGTSYSAAFEITDGTTTKTASLSEGSTGYYFSNDVSVYIDDILYGTSSGNKVILRVGAGTTQMTEGSAFTLGGNGESTESEWTVAKVTVTANKLTDIKLVYGNPGKTGMSYQFDGTYLNGLAEGTIINGPKTSAGTPYFQLKLAGFGSKTTAIDTTDVVFETSGTESITTPTGGDKMSVTWKARDGATQKWNPTDQSYIALALTDTGVGGTSNVNLDATNSKRWTIVNDKVLYFNTAVLASGSTTLYDATFKLGGSDGTTYTVSNINASQGGILDISSNVNPIYCNVTFTGANNITVGQYNGYTGAISTTDAITGKCDLKPDQIPFGDSSIITTTVPWMNLLGSMGNSTPGHGVNYIGVGGAAPDAYWPFVIVYEGTMLSNFSVVYDSDASDTYTGIRVFKSGDVNATGSLNVNESYTNVINQAQLYKYDNLLYHYSTYSGIYDGSVQDKLTVTLAETARNALVEISQEASVGGGVGEQEAGEGDTVSGVEIVSINCEAAISGAATCGSGLGGLYYSKKTAMMPEELVTTDTAVTATYQVVIGGPYVNKIAQGMTDADKITQMGAQFIIAEGNKVLVAGYTATDTTAAANEFINLLK